MRSPIFKGTVNVTPLVTDNSLRLDIGMSGTATGKTMRHTDVSHSAFQNVRARNGQLLKKSSTNVVRAFRDENN